MTHRHPFTLTLTLLALATLLAGCAAATPTPAPAEVPAVATDEVAPATDEPAADAELISIRLALGYIPDIQFAPYYVGIEKGFFAEHGLDVTTEHHQETDAAKLVATGEIKFAVLSGEQVLLAREEGLPLVYVFEWYQRFPVAVAVQANAGVSEPADLAGLTIGTPVKEGASYIGLEALLGSAGLTDNDIDLQTIGYSQVETLATGRADAVVIYTANEPLQLDKQGVDYDLLPVSDYADLVSNGLVTSEDALASDPELVRGMVAALSDALRYTNDHPDEAFEISKTFVEGLDDPEVGATAQAILGRSIEQWDAEELGHTDAESWAAMQDLLLSLGLLDAEQDLDAAFTNDYLP